MWLLWSLLACLGFGAGAAMQKHGVATRLPALSLRTLVHDWRGVLRGLLLNWVWLLGLGVNLCGAFFMVLAVASGQISVVQPLINLNVLVAILAGVLVLRERLSPVEWTGAATLLLGAGLVTVAATRDAAMDPAGPHLEPAMDGAMVAWMSLAAAGVAAGLPLALRALRGRASPEPFLAVAAGIWFGLSTVLLKVLAVHLGEGDRTVPALVVAAALDWALWGIVAANVVGFVQFQMAFSHGRVAVVSPLTTIASMVPPVVAGLVAMGEPAHPLKLAGVTVVAAGTAMLFAKGPGRDLSR
jgi:drug/metabolite transporter (DMT)-like permease